MLSPPGISVEPPVAQLGTFHNDSPVCQPSCLGAFGWGCGGISLEISGLRRPRGSTAKSALDRCTSASKAWHPVPQRCRPEAFTHVRGVLKAAHAPKLGPPKCRRSIGGGEPETPGGKNIGNVARRPHAGRTDVRRHLRKQISSRNDLGMCGNKSDNARALKPRTSRALCPAQRNQTRRIDRRCSPGHLQCPRRANVHRCSPL